jgi:protein NRD1
VFDAIARAARSAAGKGKGKAGGAATGAGGLVNKMEGVVDRWVKGMVDDGKGNVWVEGKVCHVRGRGRGRGLEGNT